MKVINGQPPDSFVKEHTVGFVGPTLCTGTIIANNWILTAAHCFKKPDGSQKDIKDYRVLFGESRTSPSAYWTEIDRDPIFFSQDYQLPNLDIALIHFVKALPLGFSPVKILGDSRLLSEKKLPIKLAGFGLTSPGCNPASNSCLGTLLQGDSSVVDVPAGPMFANLALFSSESGGACSGDSGGPAYANYNGEWLLVGTLNGFWPIAPGEKLCTSGAPTIYSRTAPFLSWIEKSIGNSLSSTVVGSREPVSVDRRPSASASFEGWCQYNDYASPAWVTTNYLMRALIDVETFGISKNKKWSVSSNCKKVSQIMNSMTSFSLPVKGMWIGIHAQDLSPLDRCAIWRLLKLPSLVPSISRSQSTFQS